MLNKGSYEPKRRFIWTLDLHNSTKESFFFELRKLFFYKKNALRTRINSRAQTLFFL